MLKTKQKKKKAKVEEKVILLKVKINLLEKKLQSKYYIKNCCQLNVLLCYSTISKDYKLKLELSAYNIEIH